MQLSGWAAGFIVCIFIIIITIYFCCCCPQNVFFISSSRKVTFPDHLLNSKWNVHGIRTIRQSKNSRILHTMIYTKHMYWFNRYMRSLFTFTRRNYTIFYLSISFASTSSACIRHAIFIYFFYISSHDDLFRIDFLLLFVRSLKCCRFVILFLVKLA